jgi:5'-deoxynucleotidase YfbR-like HD superfamily hydrolase
VRLDWIESFTGRRIKPLQPDAGVIDIRDIAHHLSNQCRYSGAVRVHYSVAEHSVRVCELLERQGASRTVRLWGLLHDASEAYLVDLPSPVKHAPEMAFYRDAERLWTACICRRFGLPFDEELLTIADVSLDPADVKRADGILLSTEARDLMPFNPVHWIGLTETPLIDTIKPWHQSSAEREFLAAFEELNR